MSRFKDYIDNLFMGVIGGALGWLLGRWFIPPWGQIIGVVVGVITGLLVSSKVANAFAKAKSRFRTWLLEGLEVKSKLEYDLVTLKQKADNVESSLEQARNEIKAMTQAFSQLKLETLNVLRACIRVYFLDGKHENVIELCDSLEQIDKENYEAYYYRGLSKAARGHHKLALPDLRKASKIRENDPNVHIGLAEVYLNLEQFQYAIDEAESALRLKFGAPLEAHGIIARALKEMDKLPEALVAINTCLSISSRNAPSVAAKIRILTELADQSLKSWDEVFRFSDESIVLQPKQAEYYIFKALAYLRRNAQGDWQKAMDLFSEAEGANPRENRIYQYKGNALLQAAKKEGDETKRKDLLEKVSECAKKGIFHCPAKWYRPVFHELERKALVLSGKLDKPR